MLYRSDIDGLRAIAVGIVIFFHFGIPGFNGGFIGVDIFFVLSGYLIGSIILSQLNDNKFAFKEFYFRRIRRLFPVFVAVIIATTVTAYFRMLPNDFREFGQSVVASTVYLSNFLFFFEAGYFDTASHLKPLLHTWSLSVEEQFYIVFPVLAWLIFKVNKNFMLPLFALLGLISFIASQWYLPKEPSAVFYLYPFRAWEMFLGVCLASNIVPKIKSLSINTFVSFVGLSMIIVPTLSYTNETPFPGLSALIPCLGTCLLIHSGSQPSVFIHKCLTHTSSVFIGKLSYSLYLWHWPIFVLWMYDKNNVPQALDVLIMTLLTLGASILSWKYIETPFREGRVIFSKTPFAVFSATAASSIILIAIGFLFHASNGLPQRLNSETAAFANAANDLFGDLTGCKEKGETNLNSIEYCPIGDPFNADKYTLVWADSHGGAYKRGLEHLIDENKHPILLAWTGGCPPLLGISKDESFSSSSDDSFCADRNAAIKKIIENDKRINAVILVGRWAYYSNGEGVGVDRKNKISIWPANGKKTAAIEQSNFIAERINKTIQFLNDKQIKVFAVEQPPEFPNYQARFVALGLINGSLVETIKNYTTVAYKDVLNRQQNIMSTFSKAEEAKEITLLNTHHYFCNDNLCSLMIDGLPSYFDNNHLSSNGAVKISDMFLPLKNLLDSPAKK